MKLVNAKQLLHSWNMLLLKPFDGIITTRQLDAETLELDWNLDMSWEAVQEAVKKAGESGLRVCLNMRGSASEEERREYTYADHVQDWNNRITKAFNKVFGTNHKPHIVRKH